MKKIKASILLVLIMLAASLTLAACNNNKVESISIDSQNMPAQIVFVKGNDLDISDGKLTIKYPKKTEEIALSNSEIDISGYDKNTLGEQELTITYKEKTTKLTISVIDRLVVKNHKSSYLLGDALDKSQGELIVASDDGTTISVPLNDNTITTGAFNSTTAGEVAININYASYIGSFNVMVYAPDVAEFHAPSKIQYLSHENGLSLSGGYITLKANDGTLSKQVELNSSMVSGFNLNAANAEHMTTPLIQSIKVSYEEWEFNYDIEITYSEISFIREAAEDLLRQFNWSGREIPQVEENEGLRAIDALKMYFSLSSGEKAYITYYEQEDIMRPAVVYAYNVWRDIVLECPNIFEIDGGSLYLLAQDYLPSKSDYTKLLDNLDLATDMAQFIGQVTQEYGNFFIIETLTVEQHTGAATNFEIAVQILEYMLDAYDLLKDIPLDWTISSLENKADIIEAAYEFIKENSEDYTTSVYERLCVWRADYFDILYSYYCYIPEEWEEPIDTLKDIYLTAALQEIYETISSAMGQMINLSFVNVIDTTNFMYYYNKALRLDNDLYYNGSELDRGLYTYLEFAGFLSIDGEPIAVTMGELIEFLANGSGGYNMLMGSLLGDAEANELWSIYLDIVEGYYNEDDYFETEEFGILIEALFEGFVAMSPAWQSGFISTVNAHYYSAIPEYALDFSRGYYSLFIYLIANYYFAQIEQLELPQQCYQIFYDLVMSLEHYSLYQVFKVESDLEGFFTFMSRAKLYYINLSTVNQEAVDQLFGFMYEKYVGIFDRYDSNKEFIEVDVGEWGAIFAQITAEFYNMNSAINLLNSQVSAYSAFFASYLNAKSLADYVIENAPIDVLNTYYCEIFPLFSNMSVSLDSGLYFFRDTYAYFISTMSVKLGGYSYKLVDFLTPELEQFMAKSSYIIWTYIYTLIDEETTFSEPQKVFDAMEAFRNLNSFEQILYNVIIDSSMFYYEGIAAFFREILTEGAFDAGVALLNFELAYVNFLNGASTNKDAFIEAKEALVAEYEKLEGEDLESFETYLLSIYEYYLSEYAKLEATFDII